MDWKEDTRARFFKAAKHITSREERKELERKSQERKSNNVKRRPRRAPDALEEEEAGFERMTTARREPTKGGRPGPTIGAKEPEEGLVAGLVLGLGPGRARVEVDGAEVEGELSDELSALQRGAIAVGDAVGLRELEPGRWRVVRVEERHSWLGRPDPGRPDIVRLVAANVDVGVIVAAVRQPMLRQRLIDRYLIALQRGGVEPIVCASKIDLLETAEDRRQVDEALEPYRALGCPVVQVSAERGDGIDELRGLLAAKLAVVVGQSGVGKSSLLSSLAPGLELDVGRVREGDGKGRHTTTHSSLHAWRGLRLIDTPGVRSFGLAGIARGELAGYFSDLDEHARDCRFRNCLHLEEPGCAVREVAAVIDTVGVRYATYLRVLESLE